MRGETDMRVIAKYDQIVGWDRGKGEAGDKDFRPAGPADRCHHFTIGNPGDPISGGLYIKLGEFVPENIVLFMPYMPKLEEPKS
jgi:hypothetical protein